MSGFFNSMNDFLTLCLRKNLSTSSLSLFTYKVQCTWFFQSNISTKTFHALQIEWQKIKLLNHSHLTKSNLLYSFNYTHDDYNLQPNRKFYQKKYLFTGLTIATKSSFSFQSTIWLRPAWKRQESVNFPTLIWRIKGSSDTPVPVLSELARVSLITLICFWNNFKRKMRVTGHPPDLRTCRTKRVISVKRDDHLKEQGVFPMSLLFCVWHTIWASFRSKKMTKNFIILSYFFTLIEYTITQGLCKNLSMFFLSHFSYQDHHNWYFQSNISTKTFQVLQIEW